MIYHKHVSDREFNILTPPVGRNNFSNSVGSNQGWEFAHRFSEQIARFLRKNEQFPHFW